MPHRHAEHELLFVPDYRLFTVRDRECDAAVDAATAIETAVDRIAASTGYEVYVCVAQDRLKVRARLEFWDGQPAAEQPWSPPLMFKLVCPSGEIRMGDATGAAIGGLVHPAGPGRYRVFVSHRGRDDAQGALRDIDDRPGLSLPQRLAEYDRYAGVEQYRIQLWYEAPAPDDEDADE